MKKVAVFTLTRDRLEYTKRMLKQLKETAGIEYDHFILDNGSQDGSYEWLKEQGLRLVVKSEVNMGLWRGIQYVIDFTKNFKRYDYVIKIDNDMEFHQNNWLKDLIEVYDKADFDVLSPFVEGVCNGAGGLERLDYKHIPNALDTKGVTIGYVPHVGGACLLSTPDLYYEELPNGFMATGWDTWFCAGLRCGVVEDIHVIHKGNEEKGNEEYHARQRREEKMKYEK